MDTEALMKLLNNKETKVVEPKEVEVAVPGISKESEERKKWLNQQFSGGEYIRRGLYNTPINSFPKRNYPA